MKIVPEELRQAHEDGDVIFVCGAGVSKPAGLPLFNELVQEVLSELLPQQQDCKPGSTNALAWSAYNHNKFDEALDILESPGQGGFNSQDVRKCIREHLKGRTKTLENHLTLCRLADLDGAQGRLVTTNFDRLFENAYRKIPKEESERLPLKVHVAPTLPPARPDSCKGLIYLHGRLDSSPENRELVLTIADFGTAYMLESWARRFVVEMFRHYHVVFIGYRVEDPTMRYLVSALAAARETSKHFKQAYAFAPYGGVSSTASSAFDAEQEWSLKGLKPLPYDVGDGRHEQLWRELREWADDHRQGIFGRQQTVARLGSFPPSDKNDPNISELAWALKDANVAKHFAELKGKDRPVAEWIEPLQQQGLLSLPVANEGSEQQVNTPLASRALHDSMPLHRSTALLGAWIASSIDSPKAVQWAIDQGAVLHLLLRWEIGRDVSRRTSMAPAFRKFWQVLADERYAHMLAMKSGQEFPRSFKIGQGNHFENQSFLNALRPIPVFSRKSHYTSSANESPDPNKPTDWYNVDIELVGFSHAYEIDRILEKTTNKAEALSALAFEISDLLKAALDWLGEFGLAGPEHDPTYIEYRSISPSAQTEHADVWTRLIELARDAFDALVARGETETSELLVDRWRSLQYPVFKRLALYAATGGQHA